jgi:DNA helicase-2/ATP-dependent DNA helicase PcrA
MRSDNVNSIAVICRTAKESNKIYHLLQPVLEDIQQITRETDAFRGSCVVLPSYCAKGLEFDGVIVTDITRYLAGETNLLYTICTRSLHRLVMYNLTGQQPDIQFDETMVDTLHRDSLVKDF